MYYPILIKEWMKYPTKIMLLIYIFQNEGKTISRMRRDTKVSIKQQWIVLKEFKKKGFIYSEYKLKNRRERDIFLTEKGKVIAGKLNELDLLLSNM